MGCSQQLTRVHGSSYETSTLCEGFMDKAHCKVNDVCFFSVCEHQLKHYNNCYSWVSCFGTAYNIHQHPTPPDYDTTNERLSICKCVKTYLNRDFFHTRILLA